MASSLRRRMKILWLAPKKTWLSSVKITLSHWSLTFHLTLTLLTFSSLKHFCGTLVDINIAVQFIETLVWVCDSVDHSYWLNHPNGQVWLSEAASLKIFHLWGPDSVGSRWEVCFFVHPLFLNLTIIWKLFYHECWVYQQYAVMYNPHSSQIQYFSRRSSESILFF